MKKNQTKKNKNNLKSKNKLKLYKSKIKLNAKLISNRKNKQNIHKITQKHLNNFNKKNKKTKKQKNKTKLLKGGGIEEIKNDIPNITRPAGIQDILNRLKQELTLKNTLTKYFEETVAALIALFNLLIKITDYINNSKKSDLNAALKLLKSGVIDYKDRRTNLQTQIQNEKILLDFMYHSEHAFLQSIQQQSTPELNEIFSGFKTYLNTLYKEYLNTLQKPHKPGPNNTYGTAPIHQDNIREMNLQVSGTVSNQNTTYTTLENIQSPNETHLRLRNLSAKLVEHPFIQRHISQLLNLSRLHQQLIAGKFIKGFGSDGDGNVIIGIYKLLNLLEKENLYQYYNEVKQILIDYLNIVAPSSLNSDKNNLQCSEGEQFIWVNEIRHTICLKTFKDKSQIWMRIYELLKDSQISLNQELINGINNLLRQPELNTQLLFSDNIVEAIVNLLLELKNKNLFVQREIVDKILIDYLEIVSPGTEILCGGNSDCENGQCTITFGHNSESKCFTDFRDCPQGKFRNHKGECQYNIYEELPDPENYTNIAPKNTNLVYEAASTSSQVIINPIYQSGKHTSGKEDPYNLALPALPPQKENPYFNVAPTPGLQPLEESNSGVYVEIECPKGKHLEKGECVDNIYGEPNNGEEPSPYGPLSGTHTKYHPSQNCTNGEEYNTQLGCVGICSADEEYNRKTKKCERTFKSYLQGKGMVPIPTQVSNPMYNYSHLNDEGTNA